MPNRPPLQVLVALARLALLSVCVGIVPTMAHADIYVVVHPENPQLALSQNR